MLPARQVLPSTSSPSALAEVVASSPVLSLTTIGMGIGALWGASIGVWFGVGGAKLGAAIGGSLLGIKGYGVGRDLKSWLK